MHIRHTSTLSTGGRVRALTICASPLTCKRSLAYCLAVGDVYKALADATRRTILDELLERDRQTLFELCVRLASRHGLTSSRQAVSQHLEVLETAGLVIAAKEGRYKFHSINTAPLREITDRWPYREKAGTPCPTPGPMER